jgi:hypothetical protein
LHREGSVVDVNKARQRATAKLREIEDPDTPLTLVAPEGGVEYEWCWLFFFNTVTYGETGDILDSVFTGPLVVMKDDSAPWIAPSSPPVEAWLNKYASEQGGLPELPVPREASEQDG